MKFFPITCSIAVKSLSFIALSLAANMTLANDNPVDFCEQQSDEIVTSLQGQVEQALTEREISLVRHGSMNACAQTSQYMLENKPEIAANTAPAEVAAVEKVDKGKQSIFSLLFEDSVDDGKPLNPMERMRRQGGK